MFLKAKLAIILDNLEIQKIINNKFPSKFRNYFSFPKEPCEKISPVVKALSRFP